MERQNKLAWITGAGGLIGNYLVQTAPKFAPRWRLRALTRDRLDLLNFDAVRREFQKDRPQLVVHCAAISTVAGAEASPELARRVNVEVTKLLAELAAETPFIFFSTDLIFDGRQGNYVESDAPHPLHLYGETKAAAEQIVMANRRHLVVRTSLNGGISPTSDRGFNERMKREWRSGRMMKLFADEFRSPIPAAETARAVWDLAGKNCAGIYHVAGAEKLSRWQLGQLLAKRWPELNAKIEPASVADFSCPARAPDTSLDISKAQKVLSTPLPGLSAWLPANPGEPF
jgi:dTDP-4-dehydrorhamnose reductase